MAARTIEIELKYKVGNSDKLSHLLQGLKLLEERRIVDVYLDTPAGELFTRGIFMRIRNGTSLDIKFNREDLSKGPSDAIEHTHCDEVSRKLPLSIKDMAEINETLTILGLAEMREPTVESLEGRNMLVESLRIDKHRASYDFGEFHLDVDDVVGLGQFLEIEKMTDEHADRAAILASMRQHLEGQELTLVDVGYNELYWRVHNFNLYLQGKYWLAEDRSRYTPPRA